MKIDQNIDFLRMRGHHLTPHIKCDLYFCNKCGYYFSIRFNSIGVSSRAFGVFPDYFYKFADYNGETCDELVIKNIIE